MNGDGKDVPVEQADMTAAFAFNFGSDEGTAAVELSGNATNDTTPAFAAEGKLAKLTRDIVIE